MKALDNYLKASQEILEYFEYKHKVYQAISDCRDCWWFHDGKTVGFSENKRDAFKRTGNHYELKLTRSDAGVFRNRDFVLVAADTDYGNEICLYVFRADKEDKE